MMASLFAGVSGLRNHQVKMNVVGDNIANVNTIGFKLGRVTFQEALVQTLKGATRPTTTAGGSNPLQLGLGMSLSTIDNIFQQGGLESTGQVTDLAIQGSGFFVLSDGQQEYYTRAGNFSFDSESNMINPSNGFILQGKMADATGVIPASTPVGNIVMPFGQQDPASATTEIGLVANLDAMATDSEASLTTAGATNITTVSGEAINGSGGIHSIQITGNNASFSQLSGVHAKELDDLGAGDVTTADNLDGAGVLAPGTNYFYTVVAVNGIGQSTGVEFSHTLGAGQDSIVLDWSGYPDLADADQVFIYRSTTSGDYTGGNDGLIAIENVGAPDTFTDLGTAPLSNTNPPTINSTLSLTGSELLSALGITDVSDFQISVDNGSFTTITGLTTASTVDDLIAAINSNAPGVTASIQNGQIELKRDYAGAGGTYNVVVQDEAASGCDVCLQLFGNATFTVNNGIGATLMATDTFTPNVTGVALTPETLGLITDSTTGIVTGIEGLAGGGITVGANQNGLAAGTAVIETEDTQHATSITTYDSQGGKHTVTIQFTKSYLENEWSWEALVGGQEIIRSGGSGMVNFNSDGSLASFTFDGTANSLIIDPNNGAQQMDIDLTTGTPAGFDGLTSFSAQSTAAARSQDGYGLGVLSNISIDAAGNISGLFTNGVSRLLAQIYIAEFNNPGGLLKAGRNQYSSSANSGDAIITRADVSASTTITSGALEISNVDMAQEFTNMIVAQRGFQANARVITTSDEMLNELVNIKR
ncbi:MAG: flagellar hook-basal body complex protein [candidate division Zixibacteria bacterium]|nr:flagellar hook-basal body complex protein [candidate division Zixibacteria bacterium]